MGARPGEVEVSAAGVRERRLPGAGPGPAVLLPAQGSSAAGFILLFRVGRAIPGCAGWAAELGSRGPGVRGGVEPPRPGCGLGRGPGSGS